MAFVCRPVLDDVSMVVVDVVVDGFVVTMDDVDERYRCKRLCGRIVR